MVPWENISPLMSWSLSRGEGYPCANWVTLAIRLKITQFYKQDFTGRVTLSPRSTLPVLLMRRFRKKPEVAWKRGLRALRSSRHLAVNINWINNRSRKSFKMEQVNIEDVKLTPEDIPGASFKDSEICKLTVNQLKFWLKCRRVNQGGNKKVLYERYILNFKVKFMHLSMQCRRGGGRA